MARKTSRGGMRTIAPARVPPAVHAANSFLSRVTSPIALATLAIVAFGVALRLPHLAHDLPWFMEEAIPLRNVLSGWMTAGHPDWNPHRFHYPSLVYDLHVIVQIGLAALGRIAGWWRNDVDFLISYVADPTRMVIAGRAIHLVADLVTIVATARAGERLRPGAGLLAAVLVAGSASLIRTSRLIYTDTILAALAVVCIERVIAYLQEGGAARLRTAALFAGLAAGAKYPGITLLVPMVFAVIHRERRRAAIPILTVVAIAVVTFLVTTPFAVFDFHTFAGDIDFLRRLTSGGHLGNFDRIGLGFHLRNLIADLGLAGTLALAAALPALWLRRKESAPVIAVLLAFLVFAAPIAVAMIEVERYLVPVLPFAALLAAWGALTWAAAMTGWMARVTAIGVALAVGAPVVLTGIDTARVAGGSTQIAALHWCEQHLTTRDLVVSEIYGPPLITRMEVMQLEQYRMFQAASPAVQQRCRARRWYASVPLPITTVGRVGNPVRDAAGRVTNVEVMPQAAELDGAFYDLRLFADVDYVITSDAVRGRFVADSVRFPAPNRLYRVLDQDAEVAARFKSGATTDGPEIVIYRIGRAARDRFAEAGELDPLWWTAPIPDTYRAQAQTMVTGRSSGVVPAVGPDGAPSAWLTSLRPLFATRFDKFATAMAIEHQAKNQPLRAWPFACAILQQDATNLGAYFILGWSAAQLDRWDRTLPVLERSVATLERTGSVPADVRAMLTEARTRAGRSHSNQEK